jgi:NAD(P)-dependent dehydrogenase (short-subunit alcohol dehydrogenase family)
VARRAVLDELADEVRRAGGTVAVAAADVTDREQVRRPSRHCGRAGPVDLLVANAGLGGPTLLEPFDVAAIERFYRVNVFGVVYAIGAVLPEMLSAGAATSPPYPAWLDTGGARLARLHVEQGGGEQLPRRAAAAAPHQGLPIAVTTICPGFVRT